MDNCGQQHHYLLHEAIRSGQSNHGQQKYVEGGGDVLLLLQRVKSRSLYGDLKHVNIMWDGGSTLSFITFSKAKEMKLTSKG